jgi:hypothetical protein
MAGFIAFLFLVAVTVLATVGAVQVWNWLTEESDDRQELANRERQAELEIQNIAHQAQVAILNEAMNRARNRSQSGHVHPNVIDGEVIASDDDRNQPS